MSQRAFTLVELLVVIGIMITLMALLMGGVMLAKRSAKRAKAVSLLGTVASAIDQYRSLNNTYPERMKYDSTVSGMPSLPASMDGKDVYGEVFNTGGSVQPVTAIDAMGWKAVNQILVYQLGDLIKDQAVGGVVMDPWEKPLRYRPAKWYPYTGGASDKPRVDRQEPPGTDSYQLWSAGPDAKDDSANPGEGGDDIPNWAKEP